MKIQRTKNAARNMVSEGALRVINILLPFVMRSVILHYLGVEFLGLGGLFKSTLAVLNLAELGVGTAIVFSMYRPVAEDDTETICALMNMYRDYYRIIGLIIGVVGVLLTPFLHLLVRGDVPPGVNLYILYFMNLAATVFSYWLFAYKNCLLNAYQRMDVSSAVTLFVSVAEFILKFGALAYFRNYYVFLVIQLLAQIAKNIIIAVRVSRMFPQYSPRGELSAETVKGINQRIRDFFTARLSFVVSESVDTMIISAFMGLAALAVYQNYYYVVSSLKSIIGVALSAVIAGVGNSLVTEGPEKNYRDLCRISILYGWALCIFCTMLLCLYQPFMRLWMGEENMLTFYHVICFTVYFFFIGLNRLVNMYKDAAGMWHKDRFRPLTAAIVNLALSLLSVRTFGLYGVLIATVISIVLVQLPWLLHNLFDEIFPREYMRPYILSLCLLAVITVLSCLGAYGLCRMLFLSGWKALVVNGLISFAVSNLFCLLYYGRKPIFQQTVKQVIRAVIGRVEKH